MASKKPENMTFEESLTELDSIVEQLESGDLALEDALKNLNVESSLLDQVKVNYLKLNNVLPF